MMYCLSGMHILVGSSDTKERVFHNQTVIAEQSLNRPVITLLADSQHELYQGLLSGFFEHDSITSSCEIVVIRVPAMEP